MKATMNDKLIYKDCTAIAVSPLLFISICHGIVSDLARTGYIVVFLMMNRMQ
ncbi:hypothetical protein [Porphyromonas loveana]|uniref:hypothetical protein n=1 Tax=Porphyromonas loveana TaxID=1884669 RepID=UPI0035A12632